MNILLYCLFLSQLLSIFTIYYRVYIAFSYILIIYDILLFNIYFYHFFINID